MKRDDNKLIWEALIEEGNPDAKTYAPQAEEPALEVSLDPDEEEEGCPNLDKLIASESDEEHEDSENFGVDYEARAAKFEDLDTPL